jgi:hypothetical protein
MIDSLYDAIANDSPKSMIESRLATGRYDPNESGPDGDTPLAMAVRRREWDIAQALLRHGADANWQSDCGGKSAYDRALDYATEVLAPDPCFPGETTAKAVLPVLVHAAIKAGAPPRWDDPRFFDLLPSVCAIAGAPVLAQLVSPFWLRGASEVPSFATLTEMPLEGPARTGTDEEWRQYRRDHSPFPKMTNEHYRRLREALAARLSGVGEVMSRGTGGWNQALICLLALWDEVNLSEWLFGAACKGNPRLVDLLLRLGADVFQKHEVFYHSGVSVYSYGPERIREGNYRPSQVAQANLALTKPGEEMRARYARVVTLLESEEKYGKQRSTLRRVLGV